MAEPPVPILEFYEQIRKLDPEGLARHPAVINPRLNEAEESTKLKVRPSETRIGELQENYFAIQLAWFDYAGRCHFCDETKRHPHSVQGTMVYEVQEFPGLYIYPQLLRNYLVVKRLLDELLHEQFACPDNRTNLSESYQVVYPECSGKDTSQSSFFEPNASHLKMQPRLRDTWVSFPITVQKFVEKLRWFSVRLQAHIKPLIEGILPLEVHAATAFISSTGDPLTLRQEKEHKGFFLDVSLGCEGIFVVGRKLSADEVRSRKSPSPEIGASDESWRQFVVGLDEDYYNEKDNEQRGDCPAGTGDDFAWDSGFQLAAIRLKNGDALLCSGESADIWHGVAKGNEGSFNAWEQNWPCWSEAENGSRLQEWKGCMRGRRIDFLLR